VEIFQCKIFRSTRTFQYNSSVNYSVSTYSRITYSVSRDIPVQNIQSARIFPVPAGVPAEGVDDVLLTALPAIPAVAPYQCSKNEFRKK
jgi:hypothetical protein